MLGETFDLDQPYRGFPRARILPYIHYRLVSEDGTEHPQLGVVSIDPDALLDEAPFRVLLNNHLATSTDGGEG